MDRKVLLIYPNFPEKVGRLNLPMGLMYVGSYLCHAGYKVCILDLNNIQNMAHACAKIKSELAGAIAVGFSVMSAQIPNALEVSKYVKQVDPTIPIIWGGVHPTLYPKQVAQCEFIDFAVRGEGEITALELLKAIEQNGNFENVRGIAFQSSERQEVTMTDSREFIDMNKLPPIEWKLLESMKLGSNIKEIAKLTGHGIWLQTSRGCPHRCAFCINPILKLRYRYKRSDLVLNEIKRLVDLGVDHIWFLDETFFVNKKRVVEIMEGIQERGLKFKWFANVRADYFRPDYINVEFALRMKRSGCELLGIGAESGSQRILDMLKKDITVEDTLNSARVLNKAGIKGHFSFMVGLPGEEENDVIKTLQLIEGIMKIDTSYSFRVVALQIYRPYPGSELYLKCLEEGLKEPATLVEWGHSPFIQIEVKNLQEYPWIKHRLRADLNNITFYGNLLGFKSRYRLITKMVRKIASLRCKRLYFKYPIEKRIYSTLVGIGIDKFLRPKSIL